MPEEDHHTTLLRLLREHNIDPADFRRVTEDDDLGKGGPQQEPQPLDVESVRRLIAQLRDYVITEHVPHAPGTLPKYRPSICIEAADMLEQLLARLGR